MVAWGIVISWAVCELRCTAEKERKMSAFVPDNHDSPLVG